MLLRYLLIFPTVTVLFFNVKEINGRRIFKKSTTTENPEDYQDDDDEKSGRVSLGSFESYAHQLAGEVILLDEKTMEINGLNYDGAGPAAWFMLGKTSRSTLPERIELDGVVIPDENENCETLKRYRGDDITLKLPGDMKFSDYDYVSMYCVRFNHNFGFVMIPDDMKLKNGTVPKDLKECDQDDLDDADDNRRPSGPRRPPSRPNGPPPPSGGSGILGGLLDRIIG